MAIDTPTLIRNGIAQAKRELLPMMVDVGHIPVVGRDATGPVYGNKVTRKAIVEQVGSSVIADDGNERMASDKLTFLEPVVVDLLDVFEINGVQQNVAKRTGLLDPAGVPYFAEVWLGVGRWR